MELAELFEDKEFLALLDNAKDEEEVLNYIDR